MVNHKQLVPQLFTFYDDVTQKTNHPLTKSNQVTTNSCLWLVELWAVWLDKGSWGLIIKKAENINPELESSTELSHTNNTSINSIPYSKKLLYKSIFTNFISNFPIFYGY